MKMSKVQKAAIAEAGQNWKRRMTKVEDAGLPAAHGRPVHLSPFGNVAKWFRSPARGLENG